MVDQFIDEQEIACTIISNIVKTNNVSHAYLIETNNYYRGFDFALMFAKTLLCPKNNTIKNNCGECTQCLRIDNNNFSELEIINPEGLWIKKEQLDKLQKNFSTKSLEGTRKIYIINKADRLNLSSSNSILKFLEEPEENIIAILVTNNIYSLLDTIVSRCQIIKLIDRKNKINNFTTISKIANNLFNNENDVLEFIEEGIGQEILDMTLTFIKSIEKYGIDVILKENSICSLILKDKSLFDHFLNILILFYRDCLEYVINKQTIVFDDYKEEIITIHEFNNQEKIIKKIEILTKIKERIQYNCNLNLLLDKLIITLGGV